MLIARLLQQLELDAAESASLVADYERFAAGLPQSPEDYIHERYQLNLSSEYGGLPIKNPFGKGSGQLSLNASQISQDPPAALASVVLKTSIAQDPTGPPSLSHRPPPDPPMPP